MIRNATIGASLLGMIASASAASAARAPRLAAVDASGRVLPFESGASGAERIAGPAAEGVFCTGAIAMAPDEARALVVRIAKEEEFYPDFVLSVARIESGFDSGARSDKGAFGLMQLMPETARRFRVDLCDPADNVRGGVRFLRALHERYHNPLFILAAYDAGEETVEKNRGVPPFPETIRFVARVINDFYAFPTPGGGRQPEARDQDSPDIADPHAANEPSRERAPSATPRWADGFVMHVE